MSLFPMFAHSSRYLGMGSENHTTTAANLPIGQYPTTTLNESYTNPKPTCRKSAVPVLPKDEYPTTALNESYTPYLGSSMSISE